MSKLVAVDRTSGLAVALALLFLFTAEIGVRVAVDAVEARSRFWFILAGLALMLATMLVVQRGGERVAGSLALAAAFLAAALGLYWLLTYDWLGQSMDKFTWLQQAGRWIQSRRPALPVPDDIHSNPAGGALAVLMAWGCGGVLWAWRGPRGWARLAALAVLAAFPILLLTMSRGAWLGLGVGLLIFGYVIWRAGGRRPRALVLLGDGGLWSLPLWLIAGFGLAVSSPDFEALLGGVAIDASALSRAELWRQGLDLVQDYPFTGVGLNSPMMPLSSYVMLLHVGFIIFLHNLFLEIAVEQGLPALLFFLALLVLAFSRLIAAYRQGRHVLTAGAAAALVVLAVAGMFDSHAYYTKFVVLTFALIGFALGLGGSEPGSTDAPRRQAGWARRRLPALALTLTALLLLGLLHPAVRSLFRSNLAAVTQTQQELRLYTWPEWPLQDALRRSDQIDLGPILSRYEAALALHPANPAANRRLGQIELSLGQYEAAGRHLAAAYAAAPRQRATRQLLAERMALAGDLEQAAGLLRSVDMSQGQWSLRVWWYENLGEATLAQHLRRAAALAAQ